MKLLVVGSGGREHALAWKLLQSPLVQKLWVSPGNPGMSETPGLQCVAIPSGEIVAFCKNEHVDFVVVGPDQALADGLVDQLSAAGILAFGPTAAAAEIEWSKAFAKELMRDAKIPTANFSVFTDFSQAKKFIEESTWAGWAVKADGLALGKGVIVARDKGMAIAALENFLLRKEMGSAGQKVVVEEFLEGREVSAFYLCDGEMAIPLGFACDYKRLRSGGLGPNTGGMGAYAPVDWLSKIDQSLIQKNIIDPVLSAMQSQGRPFKGILFAGLMMTSEGPKVIEFNARFGDPETQAMLPRISEDLLPWLHAAARGNLAAQMRNRTHIQAHGHCVHIVLAAHGYPGTEGIPVRRGDPIQWERTPGTEIFFAGVQKNDAGYVTNGGRILGLTALAESAAEARTLAYEALAQISFSGKQWRTDIGL